MPIASFATIINSFASSGALVDVQAGNYSDTSASGTATATVQFNSTGTVTFVGNGGAAYTWLLGGVNSDYEIRATLNSGTSPTGSAVATWLVLSTSRSWTLSQSGAGGKSNAMTIEIRDASTLTVLDSAAITMDASVG